MRFKYFDLVRYGKFTDRRLEFPQARRDFHMVVGPNEAGKSTLRQAVSDLLFGFPVRTPLDFLHPKNEMRLGAWLEHAGESLEFHRTKGNKNTLRDMDNTPLPDTVLDPYLGTATGIFFDKMFGLDHPRLVQGGNDMLKAQDDVGQVLFQAAAGVASLGRVYEALQAEAALLWAPKKSKDRQWYVAQTQLDEANAALKAVTVRTREWAEAHKQVQDSQDAAHALREQHMQLLARRTKLERIRRLAPKATELAESENSLQALGPVTELPVDALAMLSKAELELARAEQRLAIHGLEEGRLKQALADIHIDDALLALAADIESLEALRHRYGMHAQNIERYQGEAASLWKDATDAALQLGWPVPEQGLTADATQVESVLSAMQERLPALPVRRHIKQLLSDHSGLVQAVQNSAKAMLSRQAEIDTVKARLAALPVIHPQPALRVTLEQAIALGNPETAADKASAVVNKAQAELEHAMAGLGVAGKTVAELIALRVPSVPALSRLTAQRQELQADLKMAQTRHNELTGAVQEKELAILQYKQLHHPITRNDVLQVREQRDQAWGAIYSGEVTLAVGAQVFEQSLGRADQLADARLDNVQEAAELQNRQHQLENEMQRRDHAQVLCLAQAAKLQEFEAHWTELCQGLGLPAMSLEQLADWLAQKDRVLSAASSLASAQRDQGGLAARHAQLVSDLRQALQAAGLAVDEASSLSALRMQASDYVSEAEKAKVLRTALSDQLSEAQPILAALEQAADSTQERLDSWSRDWALALERAGLPADTEIAVVQGALALMEVVAEKLQLIRQRRVEHIDVMRSELDGFAAMAGRLARALYGGEPVGDAAQISHDLSARLLSARQAQKQAADVGQELAHVQSQLRLAHEAIQLAGASLQPLMQQAGVAEKDQLRPAIVCSDRHRELAQAIASVQAELLKDGDGYTREQIQAEIDEADLAQLAAELDALHADINFATAEQTRVAVELADAVRRLDGISGTDAAARAESQRQEALSGMADAAERYVKVFTAARLLRWSIDRYREEKQGPMLARAGAVFSQLTLGSFERLAVDFDRDPMVLEGLRADGAKVGIGGLSDGTRDQLYLALRLAALELHLGQAAPLPFIADDLFINYDDARARAGLQALAALSEQTQVIFLSHHDHLADVARSVFGAEMNVLML
ncbi:AAA family ATPase [Alcaligenaceae bacterium]|nr:AAA family ATPase [Alcaligenaceae bacterium]